jgi:hypothetical protein
VNLPRVAFSLLCICVNASAAQFSLPKEVAGFVERRESCDHWRGEYGYDEERQRDIDWSMCQTCAGTDSELLRLKRKYSTNAQVLEKLNEFEPSIEPKDKAEARRFCRTTRKPEWYK